MNYVIRDLNVESGPMSAAEINQGYAAGKISSGAQCRKETEPDQWRPLLEAFRHLKFARPERPTLRNLPKIATFDLYAARGYLKVAVLFCVAVSVLAHPMRDHLWISYGGGGLLLLASFLLSIDRRTLIDKAAGTVTREARLFGCILWSKERLLGDFTAVTYTRTHEADTSDTSVAHPGRDVIWVCLQMKTGSLVRVESFWVEGEGNRCDRATAYAHDLASDTGLKILPARIVTKWIQWG